MKVLLVNGWSDDNKGDAAIVQGLATLLLNAWGNVQFGLVSNFSTGVPGGLHYHYRHTALLISGLQVFPSLLPANIGSVSVESRIRRVMYNAWCFLRSLFLLVLGAHAAFLLRGDERKTLAAFRSADVVISKGGHIVFSTGSLLSFLGLYKNTFPLLFALRLRKPSCIYSQSIGPVLGLPHTWLTRYLLSKVQVVYLREPLSYELVRRLVGKRCRSALDLTWDTGFLVKVQDLPPNMAEQLPIKFAAMTLRPWHFPFAGMSAGALYIRYLDQMVEIARHLYNRHNLPVVLVPQCIGPYESEMDYRAWRDFSERLGEQRWVHELQADLTAGQLKEIYRRATVTIGTRFHSVILSLSAGTPAIALSYSGFKATGIMRMLELGHLVFDIHDFAAHTVCRAIDGLIEQEGQSRMVLEGLSHQIVARSADCARVALQLAVGR